MDELRIASKEIPNDSDPTLGPKLVNKAVTKIYLYDPNTGEKYFIKSDSMADGVSEINLDPGKVYYVEVEKPGFYTSTQIVDLRKNNIQDTLNLDLDIKRWDEKPIAVPNIYFEFGSAEMTDKSKLAVDTTILVLMQENPSIMIEIGAHTDNKGSDELNLKLSDKRAKSIAKYLVSKGVDSDRISGKGYGESMPIAPNSNPDGSDNPEGRAKNRRVDFQVLGTQMEIQTID
ncbi:OmpA family protein [Salibacteraceae bacterium]|nr:OmpA family protein [Salibacteraceae bacterium]